MNNHLISLIESIWKHDICKCYISGLICSERFIQAELYRQIRNNSNYLVWVEPELSLRETELHNKKPDLVISDKGSILGIIEIKFNLFQGITIDWDIQKLEYFNSLRKKKKDVSLYTDIKTGNWDNSKEFQISSNLFLIFAVLSWKGTDALNSGWVSERIKGKNLNNFYHLIGEVDENIKDCCGENFRIQKIKTTCA